MTIASATSDGVPPARLAVLRGLRPGLAFFTAGESDKALSCRGELRFPDQSRPGAAVHRS